MFLGIIMGGVFMASETRALSLLDDTLIQEAECTGKCTLNSFISLGINLSNIILGVVGALTLVMFIYGGVVLVLSGGNSEKVTKGKEIILGSVVGLLIVFGSYSIISFVINDVFEAKVNGQNAFTGEAPKDTYIQKISCEKDNGQCKSVCTASIDIEIPDTDGYCHKKGEKCCAVSRDARELCQASGEPEICADNCGEAYCYINLKSCRNGKKCCKNISGCYHTGY